MPVSRHGWQTHVLSHVRCSLCSRSLDSIWVVNCYQTGARRYELVGDLQETISIAGVIDAPLAVRDSIDSVHFESAGGPTGVHCRLGRRQATATGRLPFEFGLRAAAARSHSYDGTWSALEPASDYTPIQISVQVPPGWSVEPAFHTVRGPEQGIHFEVARQ